MGHVWIRVESGEKAVVSLFFFRICISVNLCVVFIPTLIHLNFLFFVKLKKFTTINVLRVY